MDTLTTQQLLEQLGLKSVTTLRRWRVAGLIDSPIVEKHPGGKGRIAKWPIAVLAQGMDIIEKLQAGQTLDQLAKSPPKPSKRRYRLKDDWAQRERQIKLFRIRDSVTRLMRRLGRQSLQTEGAKLVTFAHVDAVEDFTRRGLNPLLVVAGEEVVVLSTAELGIWLDEHLQIEILSVLPIDLRTPFDESIYYPPGP